MWIPAACIPAREVKKLNRATQPVKTESRARQCEEFPVDLSVRWAFVIH